MALATVGARRILHTMRTLVAGLATFEADRVPVLANLMQNLALLTPVLQAA